MNENLAAMCGQHVTCDFAASLSEIQTKEPIKQNPFFKVNLKCEMYVVVDKEVNK